MARALAGVPCTIRALASTRQKFLHDRRFPHNGIESLPQADDARFDLIGQADIHQYYVIMPVVDKLIKCGDQFGVATP